MFRDILRPTVFLALLDRVSRSYSMGRCSSSVARPSVVRGAIISEHIGQISFKFQLLLLLRHTPRLVYEFFEKKAFSTYSRFFSSVA